MKEKLAEPEDTAKKIAEAGPLTEEKIREIYELSEDELIVKKSIVLQTTYTRKGEE